MQLRLERTDLTTDSTIGKLSVDGAFECFTLEDTVRQIKIPGQTAIPAGTYPVALTWSPRFQRIVPALDKVPGFSGIRIHSGNTAGDTEGCILVGKRAGTNIIFDSRDAYRELFEKLQAGTDQGSVAIEIVNGGAAGALGASQSPDPISRNALAAECFRQSTRFEVVGSYLAAVAQYRSGIQNDKSGNLVGPFRLSEREWEAIADDPELGDDAAADIQNWRGQCAVFALTAQRALDRLEEALQVRPTPVQIYLAQIIGVPQAVASLRDASVSVESILTRAPEGSLPGGVGADDILGRNAKVLTANSAPINGITAVSRILQALTPADAIMRPLVEAASRSPVAPQRVRAIGDDLFRQKAPGIMASLRQDFPITVMQSAAILGNIGHECAGFKLMQEQKPRGGRGGWGWCQWTGSRRTRFDTFCAEHSLRLDEDAAYYGYLKLELNTTHIRAIAALVETRTLSEAVVAFEKTFEVAAADAKHYESRNRYAAIALACFKP